MAKAIVPIASILLMLSIFTPPAAGQQAQAPAGPPAVPVTVVPVQQGTVRASIEVVGTVLPATASGICSEVAGLVEKMAVQQGQHVKAGQLLCKLKDSNLKLMHREAIARLEVLKQQLAELETGTRPEDIEQLRAIHQEAKVIKERWDREKDRVSGLYQDKAASSKEYLDTLTDRAAAGLRLAAIKARLDKAVAGPRQEQIARARAEIAAQNAVADQIKDKLDKTSIRAPFSGYITAKRTELGQWMTVGGTCFDLINLETVLIRVNVPESAISYIKLSDPAQARIDALDTEVTGKVVHIIPSGDPAARTFPVEIEVINKTGRLKAGMFARAKLPAGPEIQALMVPKDALVRRGPTRLIYVVRMNRAFPVPVRTGLENAATVAVYGQLQEGELIVVRGNERLQPGMAVTPMGPDDKPATPATKPTSKAVGPPDNSASSNQPAGTK